MGMEAEVYAAILRRADTATLARHSDTVLRSDLKQVQEAVAQLTAAMAHLHEVQQAVNRLVQEKPAYSTSPGYNELLESAQASKYRLGCVMNKLTAMVHACALAAW